MPQLYHVPTLDGKDQKEVIRLLQDYLTMQQVDLNYLFDNIERDTKAVVKQEIAQAGIVNAEALSSWVNGISDVIETNISGLLAGGTRSLIRLNDKKVQFINQVLGADTEYKISVKGVMKNVYYTAITGDNAFLFFTITPPNVFNPDIDVTKLNDYKVKVKSVTSETVLLAIDVSSGVPKVVNGNPLGVHNINYFDTTPTQSQIDALADFEFVAVKVV